jgi:hypothetical protein
MDPPRELIYSLGQSPHLLIISRNTTTDISIGVLYYHLGFPNPIKFKIKMKQHIDFVTGIHIFFCITITTAQIFHISLQ